MPSEPGRQPTVTAVRLIGLAVVVLITAFPPWQLTYSLNGQTRSKSIGYRAIWNPPVGELEIEEEGAADLRYGVNILRLTIQLVIVLGGMNAVIYVRKKRTSDS